MKNIWYIARQIALIVAGGSLTIWVIPYENSIKNNLWVYLIVSFVLVLIGLGLFEWMIAFIFICIKKYFSMVRVIGVFAPYEIDSDTSSWVSISKRQLADKFKLMFRKVHFFDKIQYLNLYSIVVNPYGGSYPEKNVEKLSNLKSIFEFVIRGGVFINIADIPFYYAYNPLFKRSVDTTSLSIMNLQPIRFFFDTLVTKKLKISVYGSNESFGNRNVKFNRVFVVEKGIKNLFDKTFSLHPSKELVVESSPIVAVPYGRGFFVFSTIEVTIDNMDEVMELILRGLNKIKVLT